MCGTSRRPPQTKHAPPGKEPLDTLHFEDKSTDAMGTRRLSQGGVLWALIILRSGADAEHLSPAGRADPLGCWFAVLHGNALRIPDLLLGSALNAIGFHHTPHN